MTGREEIEERKAELSKMVAVKDIPGIGALYEEDVWQLPPDMPLIQGRDRVVNRFGTFLDRVESLDWKSEIIEVFDGGDIVVDVSHIRNSGQLRSGGTHTQKSKHIVVWRRQPDGTLKIAAEVINRDAPNPAPNA